MTDEELKELIERNAKAVQAMLDARADDRLKFQAFQRRSEAMVSGSQKIAVRLANVQREIACWNESIGLKSHNSAYFLTTP